MLRVNKAVNKDSRSLQDIGKCREGVYYYKSRD